MLPGSLGKGLAVVHGPASFAVCRNQGQGGHAGEPQVEQVESTGGQAAAVRGQDALESTELGNKGPPAPLSGLDPQDPSSSQETFKEGEVYGEGVTGACLHDPQNL